MFVTDLLDNKKRKKFPKSKNKYLLQIGALYKNYIKFRMDGPPAPEASKFSPLPPPCCK